MTHNAKLRVGDALVELVMETEDVRQRRIHGLQAAAQAAELCTNGVRRRCRMLNTVSVPCGTHRVAGGAHVLAAHAFHPVREGDMQLSELEGPDERRMCQRIPQCFWSMTLPRTCRCAL
jgi:hypothetical protein